jgi:hypothetical protein
MPDSNELAELPCDRGDVVFVDQAPEGRGGSAHPGAGAVDSARTRGAANVTAANQQEHARRSMIRGGMPSACKENPTQESMKEQRSGIMAAPRHTKTPDLGPKSLYADSGRGSSDDGSIFIGLDSARSKD